MKINKQSIMRTPEQIFENHIAKVILENEDYFILDWRNENGSYDFCVTYILDRKNGIFHITGDLGACIANTKRNIRPEQVLESMKYLDAFVKSFDCSTDSYTITKEMIEKDLEEIKQELLLTDCFWETELVENFERLKYYFCESLYEPAVDFDIPCFIELMEMYSDDWFETFGEVGKTVHPRVEAWVKGYELALKQLENK